MTILSETTAFARSLLSRSLLRFGMVGSSATLCYLWAGHLLVSWARWPAPAAHGLAGLLALLAAYAGHCFWTFGIRGGDHARMLPRFVLVQGAGLWLGDLFARGLGWCGVPHGLALPAASLAAPLFLYLLCRLWVFRPVRSMNLSSPSSRGTSMHHVPMSEAPVVSVIMNCLNSPVCILLIYQYRDLDLTGRDHIDVNVGIIQCLKQLCCNTRIVDHTGTHYGNLGNICVCLQSCKTQFSLVGL